MLQIHIDKVGSNNNAHCNCSQGIVFGEARHFTFLFIFKTCLISWPLINCLLWTMMNSSKTSSRISKGDIFSFFCLCSKVYTPFKANINKGWSCLRFDNAFTFAVYSKKFTPFTRCTPLTTFLNGGYNLSLKGFLLESATLSHPFFLFSLICIFESFLEFH